MPGMTRAATARPQEDALLGRPRQAAFLTAGVVAVTAVVFVLVADHGTLARIQRLDDAWLRLMISGRAPALTAIANDYGYDQVFSRQVQGLGRRGDVLIGLTTSGRSPNILTALQTARELGLVTVGFTGTKDHAMTPVCDHLLIAPSDDTPVIQQIHLAVAHGICETIERAMMGGT